MLRLDLLGTKSDKLNSSRYLIDHFIAYFITSCFLVFVSGCYPTPGPDKTLVGAVLGAGWGTGAGAVVGNQVNDVGPGMAVGAGIGAASGIMTGVGLDIAEGRELAEQRELDALKSQVALNQQALLSLQESLDSRGEKINAAAINDVVYFDFNRASLRLGAVEQLERFALAIRRHPFVRKIQIHGHSDFVRSDKVAFVTKAQTEADAKQRAQEISEARGRTVLTFLAAQGISSDIMEIIAHGADQPIATNLSEEGRQLNNRVEVVIIP